VELKDEQKINAPRDVVYAALNDPDVLKQCIPGCETLEKTSDTDMTATVTLKVGPVKAKFKGAVELSNLNPPSSYTITGEGKGGPAGFAKGSADVNLIGDGTGTILQYDVHADVGGKLAQLGGRLIDSTSKKLAGQFFEKFGAIVEAEGEGATPQAQAIDDGDKTRTGTSKLWIYVAVAAITAIVIYILV